MFLFFFYQEKTNERVKVSVDWIFYGSSKAMSVIRKMTWVKIQEKLSNYILKREDKDKEIIKERNNFKMKNIWFGSTTIKHLFFRRHVSDKNVTFI